MARKSINPTKINVIYQKDFPAFMERRAKQLATFSKQEFRRAVNSALNRTAIKIRNTNSKRNEKKVGVPAARINKTVPIKRSTPKTLYTSIGVYWVGIPFIELAKSLRNTKKLRKGQISPRQLRTTKKGLAVRTSVRKQKSTFGGDGTFKRVGGRSKKTQIFKRITPGYPRPSTPGRNKRSKYGRSDHLIYVPKVTVYPQLNKTMPAVMKVINKTYYPRVLFNEYNYRFNKYVN